jgi:1-acyl-sn-glycerol-3-phosphate acyltransferase
MVRLLTEVMLQLQVVRKAPMPRGAKILAVNHPTTSDPFVITNISREHSIILIKDVLFKIPVFGKYLKWCGHISVSEGEGMKAFEKARKYLAKGKTIIMFMEGDISPPAGRFGNPKTGTVRLALTCNVPIIPIGIGVKKANIKLLYSRVGGIKELGTWYFWGPYVMTVGKPINLSGRVTDRTQVRELSRKIMRKVVALSRESEKRISTVHDGKSNSNRLGHVRLRRSSRLSVG